MCKSQRFLHAWNQRRDRQYLRPARTVSGGPVSRCTSICRHKQSDRMFWCLLLSTSKTRTTDTGTTVCTDSQAFLEHYEGYVTMSTLFWKRSFQEPCINYSKNVIQKRNSIFNISSSEPLRCATNSLCLENQKMLQCSVLQWVIPLWNFLVMSWT